MKKIIASLLTALMLFGTAAIFPAAADIVTAPYSFIDTCYSPELDVYVAYAKDFTHAHRGAPLGQLTPGRLYYSKTGEQWEATRSINVGTHYAFPETRQSVVWWPAAQRFFVIADNNLLESADGKTWSITSAVRSNSTIEARGDNFVVVTGSVVREYNSYESLKKANDAASFTAHQVGTGLYLKGAGIGAGEDPLYLAVDSSMLYLTSMVDGATVTRSVSMGTNGGLPNEVVYSNALNGWLIVCEGKTSPRFVQDQRENDSFFVICKAMNLPNGGVNNEALTAIASSDGEDGAILAGTVSGKLYVTTNTDVLLETGGDWEAVTPGYVTEEIGEEIRSISALPDGSFFAATLTKTYMVCKTEQGWEYYDTTTGDIVLSNARVEIPETGTATEQITAVYYNYKKTISQAFQITALEPISTLPDGIRSDSLTDTAELSVDSTVNGAQTVVYQATASNGKTKELTVTIVDEASIELRGAAGMAAPSTGEPDERYPYEAVVVGTDGEDMTRTTVIEVDMTTVPDGVRYDEATHTFILSSAAEGGTIKLSAYSQYNPANRIEKEITISPRVPNRVELTEGTSSLYIPDEGEKTAQYAAEVYDQTDKLMPEETVVWSLAKTEIDTLNGIDIDPETGLLTVDSTAVNGVISVVATSQKDNSVLGQKDVALLYTDLRCTQEDAKLPFDPSVPQTENLDLKTTGQYGSDVTWESGNEALLKPDGTISRPSRENQTVTLTVTAKKNEITTKVKHEVIIKKADNLCINGDFSTGTAEGWQAMNESSFTLGKEGDTNVLRVLGKGVFQTIPAANDSSFAYEVRFKAQAGKVIRLASQNGGTIAELTADGTVQTIKGVCDYRRQKEAFADNIYIECNGETFVYGMKAYEITLEQEAVTAAVNQALYTKNAEDIKRAKELLDAFYDLPVKTELSNKLANINTTPDPGNPGRPSTNPSGGRPSGGGGGGGAYTPIKSNGIPAPVKPEDNYADELDSYLLKFKDMKTHWAREDVEYMGSLDLISGNGEGQFVPDANISRAEFAALITRTMGLEETAYENSFFDVVEDNWYAGYVQTVRSNGYMNGYDGLFHPNEPITREEIAKVIVAAYNGKTNGKLESGKALYFSDLSDISYWAYDYIVEAVNLGFVNGVTQDVFAPRELATRAQAAVMLRRVYDKLNVDGQ